jgi:hypothetical protein
MPGTFHHDTRGNSLPPISKVGLLDFQMAIAAVLLVFAWDQEMDPVHFDSCGLFESIMLAGSMVYMWFLISTELSSIAILNT